MRPPDLLLPTPFNSAQIVRDRATKAAFLEIDDPRPWRLLAGCCSPKGTDRSRRALLAGEGPGLFPIPPVIPVFEGTPGHSVFCLETDGCFVSLAERLLPMQGGFNFRDLGGYPAANGQRVKWGKLFRADELGRLDAKDLAYLASIPIARVVDLRMQPEVAACPDKLPAGAKYLHLAIHSAPLDPELLKKLVAAGPDAHSGMSSEDERALMLESYRIMVSTPQIQNDLRAFFKLLMDPAGLPILYHCSAGKDRTGLLSALILFALGVPPETVMQDYLLSNPCLQGKYSKTTPVYRVDEEYLNLAVAEMTGLAGSVEGYLENVLKLDLAAFKKLYLSKE